MSVEQMNTINRLKNEIKSITSNSQVPEDSIHAQNTLEWLVRLKPDADEALRIAALGHDIERAMERSKVKRENFSDFDTRFSKDKQTVWTDRPSEHGTAKSG